MLAQAREEIVCRVYCGSMRARAIVHRRNRPGVARRLLAHRHEHVGCRHPQPDNGALLLLLLQANQRYFLYVLNALH